MSIDNVDSRHSSVGGEGDVDQENDTAARIQDELSAYIEKNKQASNSANNSIAGSPAREGAALAEGRRLLEEEEEDDDEDDSTAAAAAAVPNPVPIPIPANAIPITGGGTGSGTGSVSGSGGSLRSSGHMAGLSFSPPRAVPAALMAKMSITPPLRNDVDNATNDDGDCEEEEEDGEGGGLNSSINEGLLASPNHAGKKKKLREAKKGTSSANVRGVGNDALNDDVDGISSDPPLSSDSSDCTESRDSDDSETPLPQVPGCAGGSGEVGGMLVTGSAVVGTAAPLSSQAATARSMIHPRGDAAASSAMPPAAPEVGDDGLEIRPQSFSFHKHSVGAVGATRGGLRKNRAGRSPAEGAPKSVRFAEGTAAPSIPGVAVGIIKHEYKTGPGGGGGHMEYTIQVWQNNRSWMVSKRYSQFQTFHTELAAEFEKMTANHVSLLTSPTNFGKADMIGMHGRVGGGGPGGAAGGLSKSSSIDSLGDAASGGFNSQYSAGNSGIVLPELPKKRWFETQRWLNRNDHMYAYLRRQALQDYLKAVVKITGLTIKSVVLQQFLGLEKNSMNVQYESFGGSSGSGGMGGGRESPRGNSGGGSSSGER